MFCWVPMHWCTQLNSIRAQYARTTEQSSVACPTENRVEYFCLFKSSGNFLQNTIHWVSSNAVPLKQHRIASLVIVTAAATATAWINILEYWILLVDARCGLLIMPFIRKTETSNIIAFVFSRRRRRIFFYYCFPFLHLRQNSIFIHLWASFCNLGILISSFSIFALGCLLAIGFAWKSKYKRCIAQ